MARLQIDFCKQFHDVGILSTLVSQENGTQYLWTIMFLLKRFEVLSMQTTRFLEFGSCLELHLVHLDIESPIGGLFMGVMSRLWLAELGTAVAMREDRMGMENIDPWRWFLNGA